MLQALLSLPLLLGLAAAAQAQPTLVSNVGQSTDGIGNLSLDWAQEFTTGSHVKGYTVNSVDIRFRDNNLNDVFRTNNPRLTVTIRNKSNRDPGTIVGTLKLPASSPTFTSSRVINFPAPGNGIKLSPSTTYFLMIDVDDQRSTAGNTRIRTIDSDDEDAGGTAGFSIGNVGSTLQWWVNPPSWDHSGNSLQIGINGKPNPITDLVQMSNATKSIAEFGNHKDNGGVRVVVEIGDGMSLQGYARTINYTVGGSADRGDGKDYTIDGCTSSTCSVRLPANRHSAVITINVNDDGIDEGNETIELTLKDGNGYTVNDAKKTTTVTINDDDTRGLTFHRRWPDVPEGGSRTYTVKLKSQPTEPVEVSIASNNPDVTANPTSLLFNPTSAVRWDTAQTVTVHAAHDSDAEDDEATLTHTTSGGDYGGANALSIGRPVSVKDDEPRTTTTGPQLPRISLDGGPDVTEGSPASFTVNADPAPTSSLTVSVEVFEPPGQDFVAASQERARTVVLNAGATSATFTVPTVDDNTDEDDGYVQAFVNDGAGYVAGQGSAVRVLDNDDPIPGAFFRSTSSDAVEHGGTHEVRVELNYPAPSGGLTLRYSISGTATAGSGNDFTIQNAGTVTVAARANTATIPVAINDDSLQENAETVILTLIGGTGYTVDSPSVHTLTIEDNDSTAASFSTASSSATESAGTHTVTVNLNQAASTGGLTIGYTVTGTATAGSGNDFTIASSGSLSIAEGSSSADIAVAINNDSTEETAETVILTLTSGTGYTLGRTTTHTLIIADNDPPASTGASLAILGGSTVPEGADVGFNLVFPSGTRYVRPGDPVLTLPLTIGGTATLSTDYRLSCATEYFGIAITCSGLNGNNPTITLDGSRLQSTSGRRVEALYLEALEDNTSESNETVKLAVGDGPAYTLTIKDAPSSVSVTFLSATFSRNEGIGFFQPTIQITPPSGSDLTIPLIFTDGTATDGEDYTSLAQVVLEATGKDRFSFDIPFIDDTVYEGEETFTMAIDTANLPTGVTAGATTSATVTIVDNDPPPNSPQLVLSRSSLTVAEGSTGSYALKLATQPTGTVTVNIASNNPDITVSPNPVTFQSSGSSKLWNVAQTITVTAAQDVDATDDSGTLTHTASGGGYGSVSGSVSVTVNDDDGPTNNRPVLEDGMADQTATAGSAFNYTFSANAFIDRDGDSLTYTAKLLTNNVEGPLPAWLTLNSSTRTFSGTPGSGDTGTLLIRVWADDSNGGTASGTFILTVSAATNTASFGSASSSAAENAGTRSVNVNLSSAAPSGGLTLSYGVTGTATAGSDFSIRNSGTLTIAAGASTANIPVAINDDSATEGDETVILTLTGGTGYGPGSPSVHTLTIRDDDDASEHAASFASRSSSATENAGTRNVRVNLSPAAPSGGLTLSYGVTGTATAGSDFTIRNSGTLGVAAGATSAVIPVAVIDDGTEESDETVILTLTGGTGYTLGSTRTHRLTITDNDGDDDPAGAATVSVSDAEGYKACGSITFKVSVNRAVDAVTNPNGIGISVRTRESTPVTAVEGTDFHANAETFRFNPGDNPHEKFRVRLIESPNDSGEPKTFEVVLSDVTGAEIGDGVAIGTIVDDFPIAGCGSSLAHAPLVPSSSNPLREGLVRIVNPSAQGGEVRIVAIDDAGWRRDPVTLGIGAGASAQFTSRDLEWGNAATGLIGSTGTGTGDWRLEVSSGLDVEVLPYVRNIDGTLSALGETVAAEDDVHRVALFHPADSPDAAGRLRLTNRGRHALRAVIAGIDDAGASPGGIVSVEIEADASVLLTAAELEAGGSNLLGALGDGEGQWRLDIASDGHLAVMNLVETPDGHLTNLSNAATSVRAREAHEAHVVDRFPSSSDLSNERGVVRIVNGSGSPASVHIQPLGDDGWVHPPLTLTLGANEAANLGAWDLELGNAAKGLSGGAGSAAGGDWRLEISSDGDIQVLAYVRASNGLPRPLRGDAAVEDEIRDLRH